MPNRITANIVYLVKTLDPSDLFVEELLQQEVLTDDEYDSVVAKEGDKQEVSKQIVRCMRKKDDDEIDRFLAIVGERQPDLVAHIEGSKSSQVTSSPRPATPTKEHATDGGSGAKDRSSKSKISSPSELKKVSG